MKCLILAAGYATRLYPLTENFPKPLLPVGDSTILDRLVDDIAGADVSEFIVISNHKYISHFEKWSSEKPYKIRLFDDGTTENEGRLGAVRDMLECVKSLGIDDDCLVIAGDNLLDFSLKSLIDYAKRKNASCIFRYHEPEFKKLLNCGVVEISDDDLILSMTEKSPEPKTHWCCPPFYFYKACDIKRLSEALEDGCKPDSPGSFAAWLSAKTQVYEMEMPGKRFDVGTVENYLKIKNEGKI